MIRLSTLLLLAILLTGCGDSPSANLDSDRPLAKDFTFVDLDGESRSLKQWQGKVVLLNFWAPWCPPCREEVPAFIELQEKYADRGFIIVGITVDTESNAQIFADTMDINYPVLIAEDKGIALAESYGNKVGALPYSAIIDRNGRVVSTHRSEMTLQDTEKRVLELL